MCSAGIIGGGARAEPELRDNDGVSLGGFAPSFDDPRRDDKVCACRCDSGVWLGRNDAFDALLRGSKASQTVDDTPVSHLTLLTSVMPTENCVAHVAQPWIICRAVMQLATLDRRQ